MAASVLADNLVSKLQDLASRVTALAGTTGNVTASVMSPDQDASKFPQQDHFSETLQRSIAECMFPAVGAAADNAEFGPLPLSVLVKASEETVFGEVVMDKADWDSFTAAVAAKVVADCKGSVIEQIEETLANEIDILSRGLKAEADSITEIKDEAERLLKATSDKAGTNLSHVGLCRASRRRRGHFFFGGKVMGPGSVAK